MKNILLMIGVSLLVVVGYYAGLAYFLKPRLVQGQKAFEITDVLPDGSRFTLSDLKGKYVLLDYWGSWCGPCIDSHPSLVQLYERFKDQKFTDATGFEIVSIAVEKNNQNWRQIVKRDHLTWPYHLVSLDMFNSPIIKAYNVKQIPTKFLINPDGMIISVDPSMSQIIKMLETRLQK